MPFLRISEPDGTGEQHAYEVAQPQIEATEEERARMILESQRRDREMERYAALVPLPGEVIMAEKSKEERALEEMHTSGDRIAEAEAAYQEKLKVENVDTSAGTISRIVGGEEGARFVPTPEVYQREQGERSEGIPADNPLQREPTGFTRIYDEAERALATPTMGDVYSAQHAQGPTTPAGAANVAATGKLEEAEKSAVSTEEAEKKDAQDAEKAAKAQEKFVEKAGDSTEPQKGATKSASKK